MGGRAAPSTDVATKVATEGTGQGGPEDPVGRWEPPAPPAVGPETDPACGCGCAQGCFSSQAGLATFRPWPVEEAVAAALRGAR